ncbi:hypothetical protein MHU86_17314 [Fragilaria crotonensis]|nr:hypothetical protein MHU86_17314 [Fragilaria crotonensis]
MSTFVPHHGENNNHCNDEEKFIKRKSQRRPFASLSSNTPSKKTSGKLLQSSTQPLKPLLRSASAPLVPSPREVQPHQAQIATGLPRSIFRSNSTSLELEDMWTLKRASPVFDLDDEDVEESLNRHPSAYERSLSLS